MKAPTIKYLAVIAAVIAALVICGVLLHASAVIGTAFILAWLGVGLLFCVTTKSRGVMADLLFIVTWPFQAISDWMA